MPEQGAESASKHWRFYHTESGRKIAREELDALSTGARAAVLDAMKRVKAARHMPYELEQIDSRIKAVRVFYDGCTYRVLHASVGNHDEILLAVHIFEKKDQKLPKNKKKLAHDRLKSWESRPKEPKEDQSK